MRVIYQYYAATEPKVIRRLDYPLLFSIATLRCTHPDAELLVLDYSEGQVGWQDYPDRLGFQVVAQDHHSAWHDGLLPIHLHRPAHLWQHAQGQTIYCDCDVLWLAPLPSFDSKYVHMNVSNTGFVVFDPASLCASAFLGLWAYTCELTIHSQLMRDSLRADNPEPYLHDESTYLHLRRTYPELLNAWIRRLPLEECAQLCDFPLARVGRLHMVMHQCGPRRGALAWLLRETHPALKQSFSPQELTETLGPLSHLGGCFSIETLDEAIAALSL